MTFIPTPIAILMNYLVLPAAILLSAMWRKVNWIHLSIAVWRKIAMAKVYMMHTVGVISRLITA